MSEDTPAGSGSNYLLMSIALLLGVGGMVWFLMKGSGETDQQPAIADASALARSTALEEEELFIPEPEPDAGEPDAAQDAATQKPKHVAGSWNCSGELDKKGVLSVIRMNQRQVRSCYERRLKVDNTLQGTLRLRLRVGANGSVTGVQLGGSLRDREVHACVKSLATSWRFPAAKNGCAIIDQPFNFTPKRD